MSIVPYVYAERVQLYTAFALVFYYLPPHHPSIMLCVQYLRLFVCVHTMCLMCAPFLPCSFSFLSFRLPTYVHASDARIRSSFIVHRALSLHSLFLSNFLPSVEIRTHSD